MKKFYGKYRGTVVENADPYLSGRVLVAVPSVMGEMPNWALPSVPYAGREVGFLAVPPIDANVWVEFEEGNIDSPIWTGCFWNKGEAPILAVSPEVKIFKTEGHTVMLNDTPGEGGLTIEVGPPVIPEPMTITINATGITCTNLPSIIKITQEGITLNVAEESTISMTPASITANVPASKVMLTPALLNIENGTATINLTEASITLNLEAGMITITPETIIMNEGALTVL